MTAKFPLLLFGDPFFCKKMIFDIKKQYQNCRYTEIDLSTESLDIIRRLIGTVSLDESENIVIIQDLSIKKSLTDFLLDISKNCPSCSKLIIWDSANLIKPDPKTGTFNKTWSDFIRNFRSIEGVQVVNQQEILNEKQGEEATDFIMNRFSDFGKRIDIKNANLLLRFIGFNRAMLNSEIEKFALTCPNPITANFIMENAFVTSKESLLFKFANVLNNASHEEAIMSLQRFIDSGFNPNELIVVLLRQARWQLIASYLWCKGFSWQEIPSKLMQMGKSPALIWHNSKIADDIKEREGARYKDMDLFCNYLVEKGGLPRHYIKFNPEKKSKPEALPHFIVANQIVEFIEHKVVAPSTIKNDIEIKKAVFNRSLMVYTFVAEKLEQVRFNADNAIQDLQEAIRVMTNTNLDNF